MDRQHYDEMTEKLNRLESEGLLAGRQIYLFGYCNATETLVKLLRERAYTIAAVLDNNLSKHGTGYEGVAVCSPETILDSEEAHTIVCIAARAYAAMERQLREMGYAGPVEQMVEYNSYAEYSLSDGTISRKRERVNRGIEQIHAYRGKYSGCFRIYCPFPALGDVYYMMSYLPYFLERKGASEYVIFTVGGACAQVARMFGAERVEILTQKEMDEQIQAVLYTEDASAFIAHHDRPYVQTVYRALYIKKLTLEELYRCGVFGLQETGVPYKPNCLQTYPQLDRIPRGRSVILSPYAKSVTNISSMYWQQVTEYFRDKGYAIYTNVAGEEEPLEGTFPLAAPLSQMQSIAEWAGVFVGLRSGLCDVLKWADCKKIALYPDVYYSDTRWKMEEIYYLDGWENVVVEN